MAVKFEDNSKQVLSALNIQIEIALTGIGMQAETYTKQLCPVKTGRLRGSIENKPNSQLKNVTIGTTVEYAPYVEQGTSKQRAQPYLRPAIMNHLEQYKQIAKNALSK